MNPFYKLNKTLDGIRNEPTQEQKALVESRAPKSPAKQTLEQALRTDLRSLMEDGSAGLAGGNTLEEYFNFDKPKKGGQGNPSKDKLANRGGDNTPAKSPNEYKDMVKGKRADGKRAKDMYGINGPKGKLPESQDNDEQLDEYFNFDKPKKGGQGNPSKDKLANRGGMSTPTGDPAGYKDMVKGKSADGKRAKDMYGINGPKGKLPESTLEDATGGMSGSNTLEGYPPVMKPSDEKYTQALARVYGQQILHNPKFPDLLAKLKRRTPNERDLDLIIKTGTLSNHLEEADMQKWTVEFATERKSYGDAPDDLHWSDTDVYATSKEEAIAKVKAKNPRSDMFSAHPCRENHDNLDEAKDKSLSKAAKTVKKGALHKQEGIPKDEKIGDKKLQSLKKSGTPLEKKRANFALNIQGKGKKKVDENMDMEECGMGGMEEGATPDELTQQKIAQMKRAAATRKNSRAVQQQPAQGGPRRSEIPAFIRKGRGDPPLDHNDLEETSMYSESDKDILDYLKSKLVPTGGNAKATSRPYNGSAGAADARNGMEFEEADAYSKHDVSTSKSGGTVYTRKLDPKTGYPTGSDTGMPNKAPSKGSKSSAPKKSSKKEMDECCPHCGQTMGGNSPMLGNGREVDMEGVKGGMGHFVKAAKKIKGVASAVKKAKKDYDGDGKIETGPEEHAGSVDKAIKANKAKPKAKTAAKPAVKSPAKPAAKSPAKPAKQTKEGAKPDFLDVDKDGDKKEPMKKASKEKKEEKVEETTTSGSVSTSSGGKSSGGGGMTFGGSIYDSWERKYSNLLKEDVNVVTNSSKNDSGEEEEHITIDVSGDDVARIKEMLHSMGVGSGEEAGHEHGGEEPCDSCGGVPCQCDETMGEAKDEAGTDPTNTKHEATQGYRDASRGINDNPYGSNTPAGRAYQKGQESFKWEFGDIDQERLSRYGSTGRGDTMEEDALEEEQLDEFLPVLAAIGGRMAAGAAARAGAGAIGQGAARLAGNVGVNAIGNKIMGGDDDEQTTEAVATYSDNEPDYPSNQEYSNDEMQYSGGLNGKKSTGQSTLPVVASQIHRLHSHVSEGQHMMDLYRSIQAIENKEV